MVLFGYRTTTHTVKSHSSNKQLLTTPDTMRQSSRLFAFSVRVAIVQKA